MDKDFIKRKVETSQANDHRDSQLEKEIVHPSINNKMFMVHL
jgi:hypothetical protein